MADVIEADAAAAQEKAAADLKAAEDKAAADPKMVADAKAKAEADAKAAADKKKADAEAMMKARADAEPTDQEVEFLAMSADFENHLNWDSTDHSDVVERENAKVVARTFIRHSRAYARLGNAPKAKRVDGPDGRFGDGSVRMMNQDFAGKWWTAPGGTAYSVGADGWVVIARFDQAAAKAAGFTGI